MVYRGHVENGTVIFDEKVDIPNGTHVSVEVAELTRPGAEENSYVTDYDRLESLVGQAKGLPPDLAENHDHYLHGQPKK